MAASSTSNVWPTGGASCASGLCDRASRRMAAWKWIRPRRCRRIRQGTAAAVVPVRRQGRTGARPYLRVRGRHKHASMPEAWLGDRGPLPTSGDPPRHTPRLSSDVEASDPTAKVSAKWVDCTGDRQPYLWGLLRARGHRRRWSDGSAVASEDPFANCRWSLRRVTHTPETRWGCRVRRGAVVAAIDRPLPTAAARHVRTPPGRGSCRRRLPHLGGVARRRW